MEEYMINNKYNNIYSFTLKVFRHSCIHAFRRSVGKGLYKCCINRYQQYFGKHRLCKAGGTIQYQTCFGNRFQKRDSAKIHRTGQKYRRL